VLHAPSAPELAGWKVQRTVIGLVLLGAAAIGLYLGVKGALADDTAGDGAVMVTFVTIGASVAIAFFGLRYFLLGVLGKGVTFYDRAVEADFHKGLGILPRRRTVPLLHIRVSGSSRLTHAQAITTTGHAFRLPPVLVERSDVYYLGSLGTRPIAPGGEKAREAFAKGELEPYRHPTSDPLPDHGPAWPDPGTLPITVDVPVEPEVASGTSPVATPPPVAPPAVRIVRPRPEPVLHRPPSTAPEPISVASHTPSPPGPEMEVVMDMPDVVAPPETPIVSMPPPPTVRPSSIKMPEPPEHRPMDRADGMEEVEMPQPIAPPVPTPPTEQVPEPPLEQIPPPEPAPDPAPEPPLEQIPTPEPVAEPSPTATSDEWELEEVPPPEEKAKRPPPSSGWDWEEL